MSNLCYFTYAIAFLAPFRSIPSIYPQVSRFVSDRKLGLTSQVAKCVLFESFRQTCQRFNRADLLLSQTYRDAKDASERFRATKRLMYRKFKAAGYGSWVMKPAKDEMFSWS